MKIEKSVWDKSRSWLKRNGRPLEVARWEYLFEAGSRDNVMHYLSAFQNEDGGFGHGIEPDFWSPHSSPMATWAAGQILMEVKADANDEMVKAMLSYLAKTYQKEIGMWPSVLPENNNYPHAPWWHWNDGVQENWMFNPSAELAGFLVHWAFEQHEVATIGWTAVKEAVSYLMTCEKMDMHELNNFQQLIGRLASYDIVEQKLPFTRKEVSEKVMELAKRCVNRDLSTWGSGYQPMPLDFVNHPDEPLCNEFKDLVTHNLDFYVNELSDEGIWDISWDWGGYPEAFAVAKRYWQGILLVDRYKTLKAFGYVS